MPVINTRKRKPSEASALDQLLSVSAQALSSRDGRAVDDESSSGTDSASSNSGDFLLRRMRLKNTHQRRVPLRLGKGVDRAGSDSDGDDSHSSPSHEGSLLKRRRVQGIEDLGPNTDVMQEYIEQMRALLFRAERSIGKTSKQSAWCSTSVAEEVRRLQTSMESLGWGSHLDEGLEASSSPLKLLQTINKALCSVHSTLSEPLDKGELSRHVYSSLESLWTQARQSAEHEMRSKLTFWKYKAQNLKERLRAAVDTTSMASPHPVLHDALDFVSAFYLLEMAPDSSVRGEDPAKELAITKTNDKISQLLQQLTRQRLGRRAEQPLASSLLLLSRPTQSSKPLASDRNQDQHILSRSRISEAGLSRANNTIDLSAEFTGDTRIVVAATQATEAIDVRTIHDSLASGQHANLSAPERNGAEKLSQSATKPLNLAARRRLARLLDSQLQSKTRFSESPRSLSEAGSAVPKRASSIRNTEGTEIGSVIIEAPSRAVSSKKLSPEPTAPATSAPGVLTHDVANGSSVLLSPPAAAMPKPSALLAAESKTSGARGNTWSGSNSESDSGSSSGCTVCGRNDSYSSLLLCDNGCEREFHTFCLQPPLDKIPEGDWYCPKCLAMENIKAEHRVYLCSASLCSKITGAKYCSIHRCKFPSCVNRDNVGGFCRRHDKHRESKSARRISGSNDSSAAKTGDKESEEISSPVATPTGAPPIVSASIPVQQEPTRPRLDTEQLMNNMRQMGIWLPPNMMGRASSNPTPEGNS